MEPIRKKEDVEAIKKMLAGNPRDSLLFVMSVNNGLRCGDILKLKVGQVKSLKVGDHITITEGKTGKTNILQINKAVHKALKAYLADAQPDDNDFLFKSRKGSKALKIESVNGMIKKWTAAINLAGNYGAHTLRKTFGYHQRMYNGVGFEILCKRYNHSSPAVTMRYLGIQDKEIHDILMNEI